MHQGGEVGRTSCRDDGRLIAAVPKRALDSLVWEPRRSWPFLPGVTCASCTEPGARCCGQPR